MRKLTAGLLALGVALAAPISVYAQDGTNPVTHHRTVHTIRVVHTVQIEHTAMVVPPVAGYTASHGRSAPTVVEDAVFSRDAGDCNHAFCIGQ